MDPRYRCSPADGDPWQTGPDDITGPDYEDYILGGEGDPDAALDILETSSPGRCEHGASGYCPACAELAFATSEAGEPARPLPCICCGDELPADRRLMCASCAAPDGAVARFARMLRPGTVRQVGPAHG